MIWSPATLRALTLPVSRNSTMSGAMSVESMRTRTGEPVPFQTWWRPRLAAREADDVTLVELALVLGGAERGLSAEDEEPLFVRVMRVVRPELVARFYLVQPRADSFTANLLADHRSLEAPPLAVTRIPQFVAVEVDDLHPG